MNDRSRECMDSACNTLREVIDGLETVSGSLTEQNMKEKIKGQLKTMTACLEECEHISANISQI